MDWGDGTYELTAQALLPLSDAVVAAARIGPGEVVVDVATGTGNCALAAARLGATVVGVDPAVRLLDVARARAAQEGLVARFLEGTATGLPVGDGEADCVTSVMGVIFEPNGPAAAAELRRVVRPGGRLVLTTWVPAGAVHEVGVLLRQAAGGPAPVGTDWGDEAVLRALFDGCTVAVERRELRFTGETPERWFAEMEEHHPAWRRVRLLVGGVDGAWEDVRREAVELLTAANEDPGAFATTSGWELVRVDPA